MTDDWREDLKTNDPFAILDSAGGCRRRERSKRRYLALVRRTRRNASPSASAKSAPPIEAIRDRRDRVRPRLLGIHGGALLRLKRAAWKRTARHGGRAATVEPCCAMAPTGSGRTPVLPREER